MLYIVPTPIGNLGDITYRAIEILQSVDLILAEDTRTSSKLLKHYSIGKPMTAYHLHNEHRIYRQLSEQLAAGKSMALITDAGTPGISDPAFLLVRECIQKGVEVQTLPGATAFVPALINSGLPAHNFCFEGFIPQKKGRQTYLKRMAAEERTMIFYESPRRLAKTLNDFVEYFGADRPCSVSRELSKLHEENVRGALQEVQKHFIEHPAKGEIVIVVGGRDGGDR